MECKDETSSGHTVVKPIRTHCTSLLDILKTSKVYWRYHDYNAYRTHKNELVITVVPSTVENNTNLRATSGLKRPFSVLDHETSEEREAETMQSGQQMPTIKRHGPFTPRRLNPSLAPYHLGPSATFNKAGMINTKANSYCDRIEDGAASQILHGVVLKSIHTREG